MMMVNISLPEDVAQALTELADQEQKPIADIIIEMVNRYKSTDAASVEYDKALEAVLGIFDDDITDLSSTTHDILQKLIQEKYGRSD
jgi:predicted CopG family antitoxin